MLTNRRIDTYMGYNYNDDGDEDCFDSCLSLFSPLLGPLLIVVLLFVLAVAGAGVIDSWFGTDFASFLESLLDKVTG